MAHALARTPFGFGAARFALGFGEAANFPAAIKAVAEWFPKKERAFATGIFNAGTNVGAIVAPLVVPWIALSYSWQWAFILTGAFGFTLAGVLVLALRDPGEEQAALEAGVRPTSAATPRSRRSPIPWLSLARYRQTWAFALGKFMTDPIWWFYLYWVPSFLNKQHGITLSKMGPPLVAIYLIADVGSIGGGWLSSWLIKRGYTINRARKTAMLGDGAVRGADRVRLARDERAGPRSLSSVSRPPPTRAGRQTCSRSPRTCSRGAPSARWSASAAWPGPSAGC